MTQQINFKSFNQVDSFQGTAKTFEDSFIALNGAVLNQVSVNALARHGLLEVVGDGPKPARGRTPKIYRAVTKNGFIVQQAEVEITQVIDAPIVVETQSEIPEPSQETIQAFQNIDQVQTDAVAEVKDDLSPF